MKPRNFLVVASLVAASWLGAGAAFAGPATDVVKTKQNDLFAIVAKPASADRDAKLKALFDEMLDYGRLARSSLGSSWDKLTAEQQKEFSSLLEKLVRNNYKRNLKKMLGYEIRYGQEEASEGGTIVNMEAAPKGDKRGESIELDIEVSDSTGRWLVIDIIPEGASLVKTYRSQFTRILDKDGYPALKAKMHAKLAEKLD